LGGRVSAMAQELIRIIDNAGITRIRALMMPPLTIISADCAPVSEKETHPFNPPQKYRVALGHLTIF
jgi:hypothetical protein